MSYWSHALNDFFFITFLLQSRNIRLIFRHIDMFSTCVLWYAWWKLINLSFIYMFLYISLWCDNTGLLLFGFFGGFLCFFWMFFFFLFFSVCFFLIVVVVVIVELSVESEMCLFLETCFMNQMTLVRPVFCIVQFWVYRVAVNTLQRDVYCHPVNSKLTTWKNIDGQTSTLSVCFKSCANGIL